MHAKKNNIDLCGSWWIIHLIGACRTGVPCKERLADEHKDAVRLADSQCWTSELRRASSKAISVSLDES